MATLDFVFFVHNPSGLRRLHFENVFPQLDGPATKPVWFVADRCGRQIVGEVSRDAHRVSVMHSNTLHAESGRLAKEQGMKLLWLVRPAAAQLVEPENGGPKLFLGLKRHDALR